MMIWYLVLLLLPCNSSSELVMVLCMGEKFVYNIKMSQVVCFDSRTPNHACIIQLGVQSCSGMLSAVWIDVLSIGSFGGDSVSCYGVFYMYVPCQVATHGSPYIL